MTVQELTHTDERADGKIEDRAARPCVAFMIWVVNGAVVSRTPCNQPARWRLRQQCTTCGEVIYPLVCDTHKAASRFDLYCGQCGTVGPFHTMSMERL